jgi:alpha 1,2-mannosyltransferase
MGIDCTNEYEQESGQMVIRKNLKWEALNLATFMQVNNDLYFELIAGDKDTFRFAWRALGQSYHMYFII